MTRIKRYFIIGLTTMITCFGSAVYAQQDQFNSSTAREDFTEEELKSFVKAHEKVVAIQQESEQKMINAIESEGMTVERFNEIVVAKQNPEAEQPELSQEELVSFNNAAQNVLKEKQQSEGELISSIEDEGINVTTFQEIMTAYQQSPSVKEKVDRLLNEDE